MRIVAALIVLSAYSAYSAAVDSAHPAAVPSAYSAASSAAPSADWVARQVQDRDTGRDSRASLRMRLVDRHGRVRERALELLTREGGRAGDRVLVRFVYPNDIKGTAFLVWEHPGAPARETERFLYLPSLGRVRRIAGEEAQESFVGTDFTYEDIGGREFDDYTYALLEAPSGDTYRLESKRKGAGVTFPRVVSVVRADSFVVVQADVYNKRNERQKVYSVQKLARVEGIWTVLESTMADELNRTRTDLVVERIDYNVGLTETDFSRRELEKR